MIVLGNVGVIEQDKYYSIADSNEIKLIYGLNLIKGLDSNTIKIDNLLKREEWGNLKYYIPDDYYTKYISFECIPMIMKFSLSEFGTWVWYKGKYWYLAGYVRELRYGGDNFYFKLAEINYRVSQYVLDANSSRLESFVGRKLVHWKSKGKCSKIQFNRKVILS